MSVRHLLAAAPLGLTTHVMAQSTGYLTAGRLWSLVGVALGLAGLVIGGLALARPGRVGSRGSVAVLVTGLAGAVVGALVVAAADGGPGTGYGIVGGYVSLVIGLVGLLLGGLALSRSRRTG
jgi:hypothetical protein